MELSGYWRLKHFFEEVQRIIVKRRLMNPLTLGSSKSFLSPYLFRTQRLNDCLLISQPFSSSNRRTGQRGNASTTMSGIWREKCSLYSESSISSFINLGLNTDFELTCTIYILISKDPATRRWSIEYLPINAVLPEWKVCVCWWSKSPKPDVVGVYLGRGTLRMSNWRKQWVVRREAWHTRRDKY